MRIANSKVLVAGATGVIGGHVTRALLAQGADVAVAGRDQRQLDALSNELGGNPWYHLDGYDLDRCAAVGEWACADLGRLDGVIIAMGVVSFGSVVDTPDHIAEHLMAINALAPMAVARGAIPSLGDGGAIAAFTGVVVDRPQPGMAEYCASKSALSCWLDVARREVRKREISVLDIRAPHIDTGLADRAVQGSAPRLPKGADLDGVVDAVLTGIANGDSVLRPDSRGTALAPD